MKVCICGTVKNVGNYLNSVLHNMEKIGSLFEKYVIILYYDHSNDNTLEKIKNYQLKNPRLLFHINKNILSPFRTHNICRGRNFCLNQVRQKYSNYEYFIMMDCDEVCSSNLNLDVLKKYLQMDQINKWDALSFNKKDYYDIWALSIKPYVVSMRHFYKMEKAENKMKKYIQKLLEITPSEKLLSCYSAFNGFSIYKTNIFLKCSYDGKLRLDLIPKNLINLNQLLLNDKLKLKQILLIFLKSLKNISSICLLG
jgi:hypothetical protein